MEVTLLNELPEEQFLDDNAGDHFLKGLDIVESKLLEVVAKLLDVMKNKIGLDIVEDQSCLDIVKDQKCLETLENKMLGSNAEENACK